MRHLKVDTIQFADDIMLYLSLGDKAELTNHMSTAITTLADWLTERNLHLNAQKTQVLFIPANRNLDRDMNVLSSGISLQQVSSARYLGVILDEDLSWCPMVEHIARSVSQKIAVLFRNRKTLPIECRIMYFKSIILPDFLYASNCFSVGIASNHRARLEVRYDASSLHRSFLLLPPTLHG